MPILGGIVDPGVSGSGTVSCSVVWTTTAKTCEDLLALIDLLGSTRVVLQAVPAPESEFANWTGCPTPSAETCIVGESVLRQVLTLGAAPVAPVATFVPDDGIPCTPLPLPGCGEQDTEAPDTVIDRHPPTETEQRDASFGFGTAPSETREVTYQCKLEGPSQAHDYTDCSTPASATGARTYTGLEPGDYVFSVRAADAAGNSDATAATWAWTITADTTAPDTFFTRAPRHNSWLLRSFVSFSFASNEPGADFRCRLNGNVRACSSGEADLLHLSGRTHRFTVAADDGSNIDRSPAARNFTVPKNNTQLKHSKAGKRWVQKSGNGYFLNSYSETSRKGAWIKKGSKSIKRIALVVTKGKGHGTVKVFLGKKLLKKLRLDATRTKKKQLVQVATFRKRKSGTVRVVVVSRNRTVRIEGLGLATR